MDMYSLWALVRPYVWSALRHGIVTGAALMAAKTGVQLDDATVNGLAGAALQSIDGFVVGAAGGAVASLFKTSGPIGGLVASVFVRR